MSTGCEDAKAWIQWRDSTEGQICASGSTSGDALEHRLWRAFLAGRHEGVVFTDTVDAGRDPITGPKC